MANLYPSEPELLKTILEPLLEDFNYWFDRAQRLLEKERISFLSEADQTQLLARVQQAQQEVQSAKLLFMATGQQVGIEMRVLMPWHHLVTECWQVARQWRQLQQPQADATMLPTGLDS
ncbi:DUF2605 domain-containing protein [Synechocystis sp. LKSZ1]|uniref:DUF2605 domain-containing protein n=1 Tax=Synechocystis sp. LKSZ1 TaxID=3144951 RepID=UPI00336C279F